MGNNQTQKQKKTVIIVGLSNAGMCCLEKLWNDFNVIAIDKRDYFEHIPVNIKCSIDLDIKDQMLQPFAKLQQNFRNKFQYIQGTLININTNDTIDIQTSTDNETKTLSYDYLIICTGFMYQSPIRDDTLFITDRKKTWDDFYYEIENKQSIMIVGGGIVGVELAGEICSKYGESLSKRIGLCCRGDQLLPQLPQRAGRLAARYLTDHGVEIYYNTEFNNTKNEELKYELVINCIGQKYNSEFLRQNFESSIAPNGQIFVNDYMQMTDTDPKIDRLSKPCRENILCLGDCTRTSLNEVKCIPSLKLLQKVVIGNIRGMEKGKKQLSHRIPDKMPLISVVSLGPRYAIMVVNGMVTSNNMLGRIKYQHLEDTKRIFDGNENQMIKTNDQVGKVSKLLGLFTCFCCCCCCSNCYTSIERS